MNPKTASNEVQTKGESEEKQNAESPSPIKDNQAKTESSAENNELSPQAKEAVKRALQKMSSADSPSAKMIIDKLLQPSYSQNEASAKEKISAALMQDAAFKDNFGSMMNAAKYKSQLVRYMQENGLNVYQAVLRSLQTQDLRWRYRNRSVLKNFRVLQTNNLVETEKKFNFCLI